MTGVRIREVADADLPAICAIYNHYVQTSTVTFDETESTAESWQHKTAAIAAAGIPFLVATDDNGAVLGWALGQPWSAKSAYRTTVENSIYLAPHAAGRGLGGVLLAEFLAACRAAGLREVIAVIADSGAYASLALHHRAGFIDAGRLHGVGEKFGTRLGVHLLQLSL